MANYSTDELKVLSETDLFSHMSKSLSLKSDYASINEENHSWRYLAKTYFDNSKQLKSSISNVVIKDNTSVNYYKNLPGAMPISMNEMLKSQNTNAPWLFNILKKKFHRSRKYKKDRQLSNEIDSNNSILLAEEFLEKPITNDGSNGTWIINEKDIVCPLIKNFDTSTSGQYNVSRAISSSTSPIPLSTNDSLHFCHYHYDFQTLTTPTASSPSYLADYQPKVSSVIIDETQQKISNDEDTPVDFTSMASMIKTHYTSSRQPINLHNIRDMEMPSSSSPLLLSSTVESIIDDAHLVNGNSTLQTTSKRSKSASAARSHRMINSSPNKREQKRSESTKKKKSKYYQEHILSSEEIELREALRIIDLDNIGFFPPSELRKVLKDIGINSNDIEKIEQCLPLDEDGHYSIDNLVKLFLDTKSK
ncbi:unnamed protein product [Rotaria sp. Silwood2]|nr:unnamed protein product [Rotaria sp. Silwood2]CAF2730550.1 unnamed protein product [Rotaria sp. Silwood2]CAF3946082.1 unnamed protein product [Rotaria sp. Silwood2]CAF4036339.1 unnamed protein product [Rotaria sp. Silwood2]